MSKINLETPEEIRVKIESARGPKGDKGDPGPKGDRGDPGADGYTPVKGIDYIDGRDGTDGVSVVSVEQIAASSESGGANVVRVTLSDGQTADFTVRNGLVGPKGATGEPGAKGDAGPQGIQGLRGVQGERGPQGATGPRGEKGDKGDHGAHVLIVSSIPEPNTTEVGGRTPPYRWERATVLEESGADSAAAGDVVWYNGYAHPIVYVDENHVYVNEGMNIRGPQGEKGDMGASPAVSVEEIAVGHRVKISDANGDKAFVVKDGERGVGYLKTSTPPEYRKQEIGGFQSQYYMPLSTIMAEAGVSEVKVGDQITRSYFYYYVGYVDDEYAYLSGKYQFAEPGKDGERGSKILHVTTFAFRNEDEVNGTIPPYRWSLSTVLQESGASEVLVGDVIWYNTEHYPVVYVGEYGDYGYAPVYVGAGEDFTDAVSVESVEQTTTSNIDGGTNIATITLSNGGTSSFSVKNGSKGSDGADGVSPTIAVEDIDGGHRVTVTDVNGTQSFDVLDGADGEGGGGKAWLKGTTDEVTPTQVVLALSSNDQNVQIWYTHPQFGPLAFSDFIIASAFDAVIASGVFELAGDVAVCQLMGGISSNVWACTVTQLAKYGEGGGSAEWLVGTKDEITPTQVYEALQNQQHAMITASFPEENTYYAFTNFSIVNMYGMEAVLASIVGSMGDSTILFSLTGILEENTWTIEMKSLATV